MPKHRGGRVHPGEVAEELGAEGNGNGGGEPAEAATRGVDEAVDMMLPVVDMLSRM